MMQKNLSLTIRLWKLLKPFQAAFYIQLFLTILMQGINIFIIYLSAKIIDSVVHSNFTVAYELVISAFIFTMIRIVISYISDLNSQNKLDLLIQQYLEEYSFKKIFQLNISQYTEDHSAVKEQVINRGEMAIETIISTVVLNIIPTCTQILFSLIAIFFYSPLIAFWTGLIILIVIIWTNRFANYYRPFLRKMIESTDKQKKIRMESFQHLGLIRTLGAEETYLKKYLDHKQKVMDDRKVVWNMSLVHGNKRIGVFAFSKSASSFLIVYLASMGTLTAGSIYAVWSYVNEASSQISGILQAIRNLPQRFSELEKYIEIIDKLPLFRESGIKKSLEGDIVVKNLTFTYPKSPVTLFDSVSFTIPFKKKTAFVGVSGSGKSTITKLLIRAYNYNSGSITINGKELNEIDSIYLRQKIGYVEQHVDLFDDTLKENILIGLKKSEKKDKEKIIEEIAIKSRIDQFYHRLGDEKFETIIGERGIKLSGGERQRVGIARAIIKNPDILIFDEATSSLDTENESKVMEAINDVSKDKTTIIIAHRLSTVKNADKIIVMQKGKIVGEGTHSELMKSNDVYQNLVTHQM